MSFISLEFVLLFVCCFVVYYLVGQRMRKYVLLASSAVFIGYFHLPFLLVALAVTLFTYGMGRAVGALQEGKWRSCVYAAGVVSVIAFWIACRYASGWVSGGWLFPLGLSFYSFQAISYLTEIYWQEERAERNLPDFMLYMLLFMKFLSGPIERPGSLLPQIRDLRPASYDMMTYGMKLMAVGLVKKLILADHIAPYIGDIFDAPQAASGVQLLMACLLYPVELYADFSGYTDLALGGAMLFGLRLSPNFDRPFTAQSTADFWRRWHMSLSFWVRDYVYLPLVVILRRWGRWGVAVSLLVTFVALGVWHGAGWTFVVYGAIQGVVIVAEMNMQGFRLRMEKFLGQKLFAVWAVVRIYVIFAFSLIFFRSADMGQAIGFLRRISFSTHAGWKDIAIGIPDHSCIVAGTALVLILLYEYAMSRTDLLRRMEAWPAPVRWGIYYLLVFAIFTCGRIGADNFIYLQF